MPALPCPPSLGNSPSLTHLISPEVPPRTGWCQLLHGQCHASGQLALTCQSLSEGIGLRVRDSKPILPIPHTADTSEREARVALPTMSTFQWVMLAPKNHMYSAQNPRMAQRRDQSRGRGEEKGWWAPWRKWVLKEESYSITVR